VKNETRQDKVTERAAEYKSKPNTTDRNNRAPHRRNMWPWSQAQPSQSSLMSTVSVCVYTLSH